MAQVSLSNNGDTFKSIASNGKVSIATDQPGGEGLAPMELVLSGLAFCKVATMRHVAKQKGFDVTNIKADLSSEESEDGANKHTNVKVEVTFEGDLTEDQKQTLVKQGDNCHVHQVLSGEIDIQDIELV